MNQINRLLFVSVVFVLLSIAAYSQVPPTQISPTINNNCVSKVAEFKWSSVPGALSYTLEIADNAEFQTPFVMMEGLADTSTTINLPSYHTSYFWRATSVFQNNNKGVSTVWEFAVQRAPLTLVFPQNGVVCADSLVQFRWNEADAEFYTLQVSESADFDSLIFNRSTIIDTFYSVKLPKANTTYYWRVAHRKGTCLTAFSQVWHLSTKQAAPGLLLPIDGAFGGELFQEAPFSVELIWQDSDNVEDTYDIQISTDPDFSGELFAESMALTDTTFTIQVPETYNTEYFWRVRLNRDGCSSYWSAAFSFLTPYDYTIITSPAHQATCVTMNNTYFSWDSVDNASKYRIQVSDTANFARIMIDSAGISNNNVNLMLNLPLTNHYWRVKAEDNNNSGLWSDVREFVTTLRGPTLIYPQDQSIGIQKNTIFEWEGFGEGALYDLRVYQINSPDNYVMILDTAALTENSFNFMLPNDNTNYAWEVRLKGICTGDWAKLSFFRTLIPAPQLLEPEDNSLAVSLYPIYKWADVIDADSYEIEISTDSTFKKRFLSDRGINANTWTMPGLQYLEFTTYFWRVRATNEDGVSNWSQVFSFTTTELPADSPILLFPENNSTKQALDNQFAWSSVDKAISYEVTISVDRDFENIYLVQETADTTLDVIGLNRFTNYWWKVQSFGKEGDGGVSSVFTFRTKDIAPDKSVVLVRPDDKAANQPIMLTFVWNSIERASSYHLQVSTNEDFSQVINDYASVQDTSKLVYGLEYNTTYYWRVAARNEDGIADWSDIRDFKTTFSASVKNTDNNVQNINLSPNPVKSIAILNINISTNSVGTLKIVDLLGNEVHRINNLELSAGENSITLNLDKLQNGSYLYIIDTPNGITSGKFITE